MNKLLNLFIVLLLLALGSLFYVHRTDQAKLAEHLQTSKEEAEPLTEELSNLEKEAGQLNNLIKSATEEEAKEENLAMILAGYYIASLEDYETINAFAFDDNIEPVLVLDCQAEEALLSQVGTSEYPCILTGNPSQEILMHAVELTGSENFLLRGNTDARKLQGMLDAAGIKKTIPYIKSVREGDKQVGYSFISSKSDSLLDDYKYCKKSFNPLLFVFDFKNMTQVDGSLAYLEESIKYLVEESGKEESVLLASLQTAFDSCSIKEEDLHKEKKRLKEIQARITELNSMISDIYDQSL